MPTTADFENFFTQQLEPELPSLQQECRQADRWGMIGILTILAAFATFLAYQTKYITGDDAKFIFVAIGVLVIIVVYNYTKRSDRFTEDYKAAIIRQLLDFIHPGLTYKPDECIRNAEYKLSGLYRYELDYYDGDDYIEGKIGNVSFHCSELWTRKESTKRKLTIFRGLFIVAKINSSFTGGTYILPRERGFAAESTLGHYYWLGPVPHSISITPDDPAFNRYFRVSSTYPAQAATLLSHEMQQQMLQICQQMKTPVSFSFAAGRCFIGIPINEDLFEPGEYYPGDKEQIRKYYISLQIIPSIIRQLQLEKLQ